MSDFGRERPHPIGGAAYYGLVRGVCADPAQQAGRSRWRRGVLSSLCLISLLLCSCPGTQSQRSRSDAGLSASGLAGAPDGGALAAGIDGSAGSARPVLDAAPDVMVWAADMAVREGDLASARRLVGMALAKLGASLQVQPAAGLLEASARSDGDSATAPRPELLSDVAANGSVLAVANGGLLSVIDLRHGYRLLRLALHSATIRQVKVSANGQRVATFADDQSLRVFSLPTGGQILELPLSLDFLSLGERRHAELFAFSPDSRRVLALDCGDRSGPACPLLRLRVFESERGERRSEITLPSEPLDYTSRSDGTIAVLPSSGGPRFFDAGSGMEWPQTEHAPNARPPAGPADATKGQPPGSPSPVGAPKVDPARRQCLSVRMETGRGRPWLISPERHWLLTLASPSLLCLWDAVEHRLARALTVPKPLQSPSLLSLLSDARAAVLAQKGSSRDPNAPMTVELFRLPMDGEPKAVAVAQGKGRRRLPYPLSILPLDQGGAFWTAAPPTGTSDAAEADQDPALAPEPDGQLCLLSVGQATDPGAAVRCLTAPGLWLQADRKMGPLAVSDDGRFAYFGSKLPLLIDTRRGGRTSTVMPMRLPAAADPSQDRASDNAEILDDGRLVTLDIEGTLRAYALPDGELTYDSPRLPTLVRMGRQDAAGQPELRIDREDGASYLLSLDRGLLRRGEAASGNTTPGAAQAMTPGTSLSSGQAVVHILPADRGALSIEERKPNGLRLRLQFLPDGAGPRGASSDRRPPTALVTASDGRFERIGEVTATDADPYIICRVGPYHAPLALCAERLESKGLLAGALSALRTATADGKTSAGAAP